MLIFLANLYIEYVGGGGERRAFTWVTKPFRHMLITREIFLKVLDLNICSFYFLKIFVNFPFRHFI